MNTYAQPTPNTPRLDGVIRAAKEHLEDFGGRVLPTIPHLDNSKLPMLRGGCRSATGIPGGLFDLFNQADAYGFGRSPTGYAYYPARDIVVIDWDEKNGKSGTADLAHVEQQIGCKLPPTTKVATPSGGGHSLYCLPAGTVLPHILIGKIGRPIQDPNGKLLPTGVDIFAYHETKSLWVAGPGTVTPKGTYQINDASLAMLPQAWIDYIKAAKPPKPPRDPSNPPADRDATTLGYVRDVLSAIHPDGLGHDNRFMVRAVIMEAQIIDDAGKELPEEDKIEMLRAWSALNPRNRSEDFDRKINSILESLDDDTIERAGLGSLQALAKVHGYAGPAPSVALKNAQVRGLFTPPPVAADAAPPVLSPQDPMESAEEMLRREFTTDGRSILVRYRNEFHRWDGRRYTPVEPERLDAKIGAFLRGSYRKKDEALVPFSPVSKHVEEVRKALAMLTHAPEGAEAPCWLDGRAGPDPKQLLSVSNGLLNLTTRELIPHSPAYFSPNALDFAYNPAAATPEWDGFLSQLWADDQEARDTLQEMFGLLLTDDTSHQKAFMLAGPRRSGKGTIGTVLMAMLGGEANAATPTLSQLSSKFGKASLIGKRLALAGDVQLGGRTDLNELAQSILMLTGEDTTNVERKNTTDWVGRLKARLVVLGNELPRITNVSGTVASRFIMFRLTQSFFGREDHGLQGRLLQELPGILNWSLDGLARLRQRGRFVQPQSSADALREMEHLGSPVKAFLYEMCDVGPEHTVDCKEIYAAFRVWSESEGNKHIPIAAVFGRDLGTAVEGLKPVKSGARGQQTRRYQGVGLKKPDEAAQPAQQDNVTPMRRRRAG